MPHKITLTGKPISKLRKKNEVWNFDMEEAGSPAAPKGLSKSSKILYTVFLNRKQFLKLGIAEKEICNTKLLIQGEPTLDIPIDQCPGEIGVITYQIQVIPERQKEDEQGAVAEQQVEEIKVEAEKIVVEEIAQAEPIEEEKKEAIPMLLPEGTDEVIKIADIEIPDHFLKPNSKKIDEKIMYYKRNGRFNKPVQVTRELMLIDGYTVLVAAKSLEILEIPVMYVQAGE